MATSNQEMKFNYNETKQKTPRHQYPKRKDIELDKYPGIKARILLEKAIQSFEGVNATNLEELKVTTKDLVKFKTEITSALLAIVKEENGYDARVRSGAIAYFGALKIEAGIDIVSAVALNPSESIFIRGYALEALGKLDPERAIHIASELVFDPVYNVQEKAIRVLGKFGNENHVKLLKPFASDKSDTEIQYRAQSAIERIQTGKDLKRPKRDVKSSRRKTTGESGNVRPIGRHENIKPQTSFGNHDVWGGLDLVSTKLIETIESSKPIYPITYEISKHSPKDVTRFEFYGSNAGELVPTEPNAKLYKVHKDHIIIDYVRGKLPDIGSSFGLKSGCKQFDLQPHNYIPNAPNSPIIYSIHSSSEIWAEKQFNLVVKFRIPTTEKTSILKVAIKLPKDNWKEFNYLIDKKERDHGEKLISGLVSMIPGHIEVKASIYCHNGGSYKLSSNFVALPDNPIWLNVRPSTVSTIGEGPAHYNSSENKFYCYANLQVVNGFPHSVTVGSRVTARVTDAGDLKDNFSFTIGTSTVPANSTRTIGIWMSFGGNTFDVFKHYGDVTIRLTLQTSEGDIVGSAVWAAMAQVKLALNFVGNFSFTTRSQLQSVVDNEASAIYEQQNFYISDSARFILPSSNSDFNRYRDIEMDDNKDHDCTSGSDEADDLRDDWSSPENSWLDVWCVETLSGPSCAAGVGGFSPVNGPTGKGGKNSGVIIKMSSADLSTTGGRNLMGIIIAHEVGHFLGLSHNGNSANFMAASTGGSNTDITHNQYRDMAKHGFVTRFVV